MRLYTLALGGAVCLVMGTFAACTGGSSSSSSSSTSGGGSTSSSTGGGSSSRGSSSRAGSSGSAGCGTITEEGTCNGNIRQVCNPDTNTVDATDCATELTNGAGTCVVVGGQASCQAMAGGACDDETLGILACPGTGAGCQVTPATSSGGMGFTFTCGTNLPACTPATGTAVFPNTCTTDNRLIYDCLAGAQPWIFDCAAFAGEATTCTATAGQGHCDMPAGKQCDQSPGNNYPIFVCRQGTSCVGATAQAFGTCTGGASSSGGVSTSRASSGSSAGTSTAGSSAGGSSAGGSSAAGTSTVDSSSVGASSVGGSSSSGGGSSASI